LLGFCHKAFFSALTAQAVFGLYAGTTHAICWSLLILK